jgi:serine protease inhibitor
MRPPRRVVVVLKPQAPMHRTRQLLLAALAVAGLGACTGPTDGSQAAQPVITALPRALSGDEQVAATATTEFGLALFRSVNARTARDSNLALSPISASLALGMLLNGAEGETMTQVRSTLGFGDRPVAQVNAAYKALVPLLSSLDPSVKMTFANAVWFDVGAPPSATFTQSITDVFAGRVSSLPFSAPSTVTTINQWVSDATNAKITKIVERFSGDDVALLVNATYFKGRWRSQFDPKDTRPLPFSVTASVTAQVPTMSNTAGLVRLGRLPDGTQIGELPYGGDAFVMDIIVPPQGKLESTIDSLTPARWRAMLALLPDSAGKLQIQLPKFRLEVTRTLNDDLARLGMPRPFNRGGAQLAPMFSVVPGPLSISAVLQKIYVDVNEEGTEAAAVTSIGVITTSLPPALIVDRPFLFVIRDRLTGTLLFMGKVVRPAVP